WRSSRAQTSISATPRSAPRRFLRRERVSPLTSPARPTIVAHANYIGPAGRDCPGPARPAGRRCRGAPLGAQRAGACLPVPRPGPDLLPRRVRDAVLRDRSAGPARTERTERGGGGAVPREEH